MSRVLAADSPAAARDAAEPAAETAALHSPAFFRGEAYVERIGAPASRRLAWRRLAADPGAAARDAAGIFRGEA
jgi:hypothetical protein